MPDARNSTRQDDPLPLDEEAFVALDELSALEQGRTYPGDVSPEVAREHIATRARGDQRMMIGIARQLARDLRLIAEKDEQLAILQREIEGSKAPILARIYNAELIIENIARLRRDEGLGNSFDIPGVGTWRTRQQPERWAVENDQVMTALNADEAAQFVDPGEPRPPVPKLRGPEFRKHLDGLVAEADAGLDQNMTPEERAQRLAEVKQTIAQSYPGVQYVEATVKVGYELQ